MRRGFLFLIRMNKSFRIGHLCTTLSFGGLEMNVLRLAGWMNERGHFNCIIGREKSPMLHHARDASLTIEAINPSIKYFDIFSAQRLHNIIDRHRLDCLLIHSSSDINLAVLAKRRSRNDVKLIYIQHMQIGMGKKDWLHTWEYQQLHAWVTPLQMLRENVLRFTRMKPDRIHIIPFGIDLSQFKTDAVSKTDARRRLALPPDAFICGVVGRLDYGKGQEHLIRAISLLKAQGIDVHALIVGDATKEEKQNYGQHLVALVRSLDLADRIHFHPFEKDIVSAYSTMDIFCLTSISETYGMVTIEAMAMQLPIVATNSAGTPGIIHDGVNGLLIPPQNTEALAEAIVTMKAQPKIAREYSIRARTDVEERFTYTRQCEMLEEIL